jgi:hypothetical protein
VLVTWMSFASNVRELRRGALSMLETDIGHTLSNSSWVNVMHEELENFERN